jgi:hypothetical protein
VVSQTLITVRGNLAMLAVLHGAGGGAGQKKPETGQRTVVFYIRDEDQGLRALRGVDLNHRPLGYEPDRSSINRVDSEALAAQKPELPAQTTPILCPSFAQL